MTDEERSKAEDKAKALGVNLSTFIRKALEEYGKSENKKKDININVNISIKLE